VVKEDDALAYLSDQLLVVNKRIWVFCRVFFTLLL